MEPSSASSSSSSSKNSASADSSLNIGLKIGQKIYFKDVGTGAGGQGKSGIGSPAGSGLPPPHSPAKKGRSGGSAVQGGLPPRCQVEGCNADLSDVKAYYSRHKVCGVHSKSPTVIVAGLEQRFCQQCSRFHQLPEFDQGKRSCRRRLAGHNERRRKPPPGTLLSTHYGSLSPPLLDNSSKGRGSFLMDFSLHPIPGGRVWDGGQTAPPGRFLQHRWQSNSEDTPPELLLQGGTTYPGPNVPLGECFSGVSSSTRALSLLSNQPWGPRNQPLGPGVTSLLGTDGTHTVHPSGSQDAPTNEFSSPPPWGLAQETETGREYVGLEHSRGYDSSIQNMHWTL